MARRRAEEVSKKAHHRQKLFERKLRASVGDLGLLESLATSTSTRADYARRRSAFYTFAAKRNLPILGPGDLDRALCEYADDLFLDGLAADQGTKLLAALEETHPLQQRAGWTRHVLPHLV